MNRLTVTLKQHTPLIHFQHDQEGATLRASEVKPKLDRFIKNELEKISPDLYRANSDLIKLIPDCINKVKSPYKLCIETNSNDTNKYIIASYIPNYLKTKYINMGYEILDRTSYFADNKSIKEEDLSDVKLGLMLKKGDTLNLVLKFLDQRWERFFKEIMPIFLVITNFGSRQNKGFGCFIPTNMTKDEIEKILKSYYSSVYSSRPINNMANVFSEIDSVYKKLKSGNRGMDGELRKYFNNQRSMIEWEKPAIQEKIAEITKQRLRIDSRTNNRQFVRAMLGLPELYEYPRNNDMKVVVEAVKGDGNVEIERYSSPVFFKVFGNRIYITVQEKSEADLMKDKTFSFEFMNKGRRYDQITLKTPKEFDIINFFNNAMQQQQTWKKI